MSWADRTREHQVHEVLKDLSKRVRGVDPPDDNGKILLDHVEKVVAHARHFVATVDPDIVSPTMLDAVVSAAHPVLNSLVNYESTPQAAYLDNASSYADSLLGALAAFPPPVREKQIASLRDQAKDFKETTSSLLQGVRGEVKTVQAELDSLRNAVTEAATSNTALAEKARTDVEQLAATIEQQTTRLDTALSDFESRSTAALSQLETRFTQAEETRVADAEAANAEALEQFTSEADSERSAFRGKAEQLVSDLQGLRDEAAELVGVVTGTATAGHFKLVADGEEKTADFWRWVAVIVAGLVVALGLWLAVTAHRSRDFDWSEFAGRSFLTVPLSAIAAYAGKQSGSHRRMERTARHKQLQLAALEPFIKPLDEEKQAEIRAQLAAHLFGPEAQEGSDKADDLNFAALGEAVIKQMVLQQSKSR